ncbi:MAG: phosphoglycerate dehydrogenase [Planctomycetes bacterium]|nr:phosphoglycerate dehydrogenase [Planctomycetota bacterium]
MSDRPVVVVCEALDPGALAYLTANSEVRKIDKSQLDEHIGQADGLVVRTYTQVTADLLRRAPRLKVVGRAGVALDNIDVPACRTAGVEVVHTPEANTLAVVDYTVTMIALLNRRFWFMDKPLSAEEFHQARKHTFGRFLRGLTLGIVGMGRIGSRVGRAAVGLGMKVLYNDIQAIELDYPAEAVDKPTLYAHSDIVTIHVPLTDLTRGFINAEILSQFKTGAQFINCARGGCVDSPALAAALRSGRLSGAAIDTHNPEPPPADYPLYGLENVFLTPHVAACVPQAKLAMCDVVYDVIRVIRGEKPKYPAAEGSF